jgi:hydroxypyruvate isomerase
MLRFAANITALYPRLDLAAAFAAAASDGFDAIEMRAPYALAPSEVADLARAHRLACVQFNLPMGDFAAGERGLACLPGRETEFRDGVEAALAHARALGVRQINCPAGVTPADEDPARVDSVFVSNMRHAAERLGAEGIRAQIEPINRRDTPRAHVATTHDFERLAARIASDNIWLQYDFYHAQVMQGDLLPTFRRLFGRISHLQVADTPGRHEPGTGEINYPFVLSEVARSGYAGWIGLEYAPRGSVAEGLGWLAPFLPAAR